jgi:hypothetical protein
MENFPKKIGFLKNRTKIMALNTGVYLLKYKEFVRKFVVK